MSNQIEAKILEKVKTKFERVWIPATLRSWPNQTEDVVAGSVSRGSPRDESIKCSPLFAYKRTLTNQDVVEEGDCRAVVPWHHCSREPGKRDRLVIGGIEWTVVGTEPANAGDSTAGWVVHLRRSA